MSSAAALSRHTRFPPPAVALSVRGAGLRLSMLASLGLLVLFPWVTTTGCEGTSPPVTHTGIELLMRSAHSDPITFWFGPLGLFVAALLGLVARRIVMANRRLLVQLAAFVTASVGSFMTFLGLNMPTAGEHEQHHAAWAMGTAVLLVIIVDALARTVIGARETWVARRRRSPGSRIAPLG